MRCFAKDRRQISASVTRINFIKSKMENSYSMTRVEIQIKMMMIKRVVI